MGDVERAFAAEADDHVGKPFDWPELLGKINRALVQSGVQLPQPSPSLPRP